MYASTQRRVSWEWGRGRKNVGWKEISANAEICCWFNIMKWMGIRLYLISKACRRTLNLCKLNISSRWTVCCYRQMSCHCQLVPLRVSICCFVIQSKTHNCLIAAKFCLHKHQHIWRKEEDWNWCKCMHCNSTTAVIAHNEIHFNLIGLDSIDFSLKNEKMKTNQMES